MDIRWYNVDFIHGKVKQAMIMSEATLKHKLSIMVFHLHPWRTIWRCQRRDPRLAAKLRTFSSLFLFCVFLGWGTKWESARPVLLVKPQSATFSAIQKQTKTILLQCTKLRELFWRVKMHFRPRLKINFTAWTKSRRNVNKYFVGRFMKIHCIFGILRVAFN